MNNHDFFKKLAYKVSNELDMLSIIEHNSDKLELLKTVAEDYRVEFTANELFGDEKKVNQENFKLFNQLIDKEINSPRDIKRKGNKNTSKELKPSFKGINTSIQDRYDILKHLFDIESIFKKYNINNDNKDEIVSSILNINKNNAQQLRNGSYQAKSKENIKAIINELKGTV
jgi:hypothetical protein